MVVGYSGGAGGAINKERFFTFEFDGAGRLQRAEQTSSIAGDNFENHASAHPALESADSAILPPSLRGEALHSAYPTSFWLPDINGFFWQPGTVDMVGQAGRLFLTESNVVFVTVAQFANTESAFKMPYSSLSEARVYKHFLTRRLVIRTQAGKYHTFEIHQANSAWQDKPATQAACDFIQSKMTAPNPSGN